MFYPLCSIGGHLFPSTIEIMPSKKYSYASHTRWQQQQHKFHHHFCANMLAPTLGQKHELLKVVFFVGTAAAARAEETKFYDVPTNSESIWLHLG
jgi:hypothetical protein